MKDRLIRCSSVALACGVAFSLTAKAMDNPPTSCYSVLSSKATGLSNIEFHWSVDLSPCEIQHDGSANPMEFADGAVFAKTLYSQEINDLLACSYCEGCHHFQEFKDSQFGFQGVGQHSDNLATNPISISASANFYKRRGPSCDNGSIGTRGSDGIGASFTLNHGRSGTLISGAIVGQSNMKVLSGWEGCPGDGSPIHVNSISAMGLSSGGVKLKAQHKFQCPEGPTFPTVSSSGFSFSSNVTLNDGLLENDYAEYFLVSFQALDGSGDPIGSPISNFGWLAIPKNTDPTESVPLGAFGNSEDFQIVVTGDPSSGDGSLDYSWIGGDLISATQLASGASEVRVTTVHQSVTRVGSGEDLRDVDTSDGGSGASFYIRINWEDRLAFNAALGSVAGDENYNLRADLDLDGDVDDDDKDIFNASCATLDFNDDGSYDSLFDYLDWADAYSLNNIRADVNGDGMLDFFDYLDWVDIASACS